ncbi:folylpolyglutamate synthase/dihydrofolate synthase family protein [Pseudoxanthomonas sp. CF125]|uniref:bifunctional folylpolyglutamate synthase/dihydrofolate synthase n=1 Tax=Pseudoxanthomonas sp. CF125 TaxID=1855303 RepID=UPI000887BCF3|nr:folylpolyglutamate synthase/dihydrofolate synthase family protein [Pseudoxanthomonas sp. CF125]SDR21455.1 dihydrofolate synthase / folylpolyglutamate synthase [Pseudoxanthomonas sp. CF125]
MARTLQEWLDYIEQQHPKSIELGLERTREAAERLSLGKPAAHVITVGGTNGKGSTVAFIEAIAHAAGLKVGTYTSPHLLRYNERVRIEGREASDEELVAAFEAVEAARSSPSPIGRGVGVRVRRSGDSPAVGQKPSSPNPVSSTGQAPPLEGEGSDIPLTYFEFGTLAALWLFQQSNLDLVVLEVGLGGRLDAVNIVDPDVAVITTVDIDHVDWLGNDRESIGFEKAGIARAWKPLVLGERDSPSSVLRHAYAIGANAVRLGSDFIHEPVDESHWRWRDAGFEIELPNPKLSAPVQRANAATAIAALRALDIELPSSAFAAGIASATLPGRLQRFDLHGTPVIVDVGHNPQAARELSAWLRAEPVPGRTLAVFAALADKDVQGVVAALEGEVSDWFLASLESVGTRGQSADELASKVSGAAAAGSRHADVRAALQAARAQAHAEDRILVFGSFHTVAEALAILHSGQ